MSEQKESSSFQSRVRERVWDWEAVTFQISRSWLGKKFTARLPHQVLVKRSRIDRCARIIAFYHGLFLRLNKSIGRLTLGRSRTGYGYSLLPMSRGRLAVSAEAAAMPWFCGKTRLNRNSREEENIPALYSAAGAGAGGVGVGFVSIAASNSFFILVFNTFLWVEKQ